MGTRRIANCLLAIAACLSAAPAQADEASELDALSRATDAVGPGLALARSQIGSGDLMGALATLERIAIQHPTAGEAQLLHASLLCRLDDPSGAAREFAHLKKRDFSRIVWDEANATCARPEPAKIETVKPEPVQPETAPPATRPRRRIESW